MIKHFLLHSTFPAVSGLLAWAQFLWYDQLIWWLSSWGKEFGSSGPRCLVLKQNEQWKTQRVHKFRLKFGLGTVSKSHLHQTLFTGRVFYDTATFKANHSNCGISQLQPWGWGWGWLNSPFLALTVDGKSHELSIWHTTGWKGLLADGQGENGLVGPPATGKWIPPVTQMSRKQMLHKSPQEGTSYLQLSKTSELQTEIINLSCLSC